MWRLGLSTRFFEHLLCVGQACLGLIAAQHTGDLCGAGIAGHLVQVRLRNVAGLFTDHVMLVGHDGDLRQVRYDNDLMRGGKIGQYTGQRTGGGAADTGIDLVEHQGIHTIRVAKDNLARQHNAAQLAARRNAAQGARRQSGTAAIQKLIA